LASAGHVEARQHLARLGPALHETLRRALETRMQRLDLLGRSLVHPGERLARLRAEAAHLGTRIAGSLRLRLGRSAAELQQARARLAAARPDMRLAKRDLHELGGRMHNSMAARVEGQRIALEALATNLAHLSPDAVLQRGYSITRKADGSIVRASEQVAEADALRLTFGHGWAEARVTDRGDA
jgi:exodeoxyribonuclease VII large subunit